MSLKITLRFNLDLPLTCTHRIYQRLWRWVTSTPGCWTGTCNIYGIMRDIWCLAITPLQCKCIFSSVTVVGNCDVCMSNRHDCELKYGNENSTQFSVKSQVIFQTKLKNISMLVNIILHKWLLHDIGWVLRGLVLI